MKIRTITFPYLVTCFALLTHFCRADLKHSEPIIASVTKVIHPSRSMAHSVTLWMTIHNPERFGGFQFIVVTDFTDRAKARARFPFGSLYKMELPLEVAQELETHIRARLGVENSLDGGVDPKMISQIFIVPSLPLAELSMEPISY